ncbi:hypothetical protein [Shewanella algidipiscicola]|uniref:hypothetical protein n=1 Tax=Shewanella algidipiscicola TaxID=614070 RepID=UPI000D78B9EC|nr:hypothetical protein [Shewanella algidipiscicola]
MKNQRGFGVTEYALGIVMLVTIFFMPYKDNKSITNMLIDAVKQEHSGYIYAQTLSQFQVTSLKASTKANPAPKAKTKLESFNK